MQIKRLSDTLTEVDGIVRVEVGPVRKRAVATKELLSDEVTASHYFAGTREVEQADSRTGKVRKFTRVGRDALGKPIKVGEAMEYIDWKNRAERAWYVYLKDAAGRFQLVDTLPDEDAALSRAATLAAESKTPVEG